MATESEIQRYKALLSDAKIQELKNVKVTYETQISKAKLELENANFTDWEDLVSSKLKTHCETLNTDYTTIENDVGSNLGTLVKLVEGLRLKCDEYLKYRNKYNSINTSLSFSGDDADAYSAYKSGKKSYSTLPASVQNKISAYNANMRRKRELEQLMSLCSVAIDKTLGNIKSITFNTSSEEMVNISTDFGAESLPTSPSAKHYTSEQLIEQYEICKRNLDELIAKLEGMDYTSDNIESQIDSMLPEATTILNEYMAAVNLMYLNGQMTYEAYDHATNMDLMLVQSTRSVYDALYGYASTPDKTDGINNWASQNQEFRTFVSRLNADGFSSQEFLQSVPPLSYFYQEGTNIDFNNVETASQCSVAAVRELLENGYTGDVMQDFGNNLLKSFNDKAGDRHFGNGYVDSAKAIVKEYSSLYNSSGGAFNGSTGTTE